MADYSKRSKISSVISYVNEQPYPVIFGFVSILAYFLINCSFSVESHSKFSEHSLRWELLLLPIFLFKLAHSLPPTLFSRSDNSPLVNEGSSFFLRVAKQCFSCEGYKLVILVALMGLIVTMGQHQSGLHSSLSGY